MCLLVVAMYLLHNTLIYITILFKIFAYFICRLCSAAIHQGDTGVIMSRVLAAEPCRVARRHAVHGGNNKEHAYSTRVSSELPVSLCDVLLPRRPGLSTSNKYLGGRRGLRAGCCIQTSLLQNAVELVWSNDILLVFTSRVSLEYVKNPSQDLREDI